MFPSLVIDPGLDSCTFHLGRAIESKSLSINDIGGQNNANLEIFSYSFSSSAGLCESIDQELRNFLSFHSLSVDQLNSVISNLGPGSFTGLRTGMSFARALTQALNIPLFLVSNIFAAALNEYIKTQKLNIKVSSHANSQEVFFCEYLCKDFNDIKPTSEIRTILKENVEKDDFIKLENFSIKEQGQAFFNALSFLDCKARESKDPYFSDFFHQIQYIRSVDQIIEPLYVKSVAAKTLLDRGMKSFLDQI